MHGRSRSRLRKAVAVFDIVIAPLRLATNLAVLRCTHSSHAPLQGKWTRMYAFYPRPLCNLIINSLYPHVINQNIFSMPCVVRKKQEHRQKLVKGYLSVPLDVMMAETGCHEIRTPAFIHKLLDRAEWKGHSEALKAIENEKQGLLANGTWDESQLCRKSEVLAMARASGTKIHIGSLMVIVSIKRYEKPSNEWTVKARIVFCGDAVRDEENQATIFDEIAASAPTSLGGLNLIVIVAYGLLPNHKTSASDCVKAYVQSLLSSSQPTYVLCHLNCFQSMRNIFNNLVLRLSNRFMAIRLPAHHGRIIYQKPLQMNWADLNLSNSHLAFIFQSFNWP